jgi:hypothetical protein
MDEPKDDNTDARAWPKADADLTNSVSSIEQLKLDEPYPLVLNRF